MATNVLISAAGRRVELVQRFQRALAARNDAGQVMAIDASPLAPSRGTADVFESVPVVTDDGYLPRLQELIESSSIKLIVPTIDTELPYLSRWKPQLRSAGAHVLVSGVGTIAIASDKLATHDFLCSAEIPTPSQWSAAEARSEAANLPYPVIVKPVRGSSSVGVWVAEGPRQLKSRLATTDLVQSIARGEEYTVDVWVDRGGTVRSAVPRRRIKVRGGEVSKGVTERHAEVERLSRRVVEALPDAYGPLTIQVFADDDTTEVIEINPRFGGGYPLSWEAGARTTSWAIQDALGEDLDPASFEWTDGLVMLRYDQSVFLRADELQL